MAARPSLLKQLLGAVVGSAVALTFYTAYKYAAPTVNTALILPQQWLNELSGSLRFSDRGPMTREKEHLIQQAVEAQARMANLQNNAQTEPEVTQWTGENVPWEPVETDYAPTVMPKEFLPPEPEPTFVPPAPVASPEVLQKKLAALAAKKQSGKDLPKSGFDMGAITLAAMAGSGALARLRVLRRRK